MSGQFDDGVDEPAVTAEQTAELRGEAFVVQMLLHQVCAQLTNFAAYPHDKLRRAALDLAAEHVRSAEKLLRALDDVLDPRPDPAGRAQYARYLEERIERGRHALADAS
jgi:hypothetical protein